MMDMRRPHPLGAQMNGETMAEQISVTIRSGLLKASIDETRDIKAWKIPTPEELLSGGATTEEPGSNGDLRKRHILREFKRIFFVDRGNVTEWTAYSNEREYWTWLARPLAELEEQAASEQRVPRVNKPTV
jgi:hypothetical protein